LFTRVVNHCVIVHGTKADFDIARPDEGAMCLDAGYGRLLNWSMKPARGEKPLPGKLLSRFGPLCLRRACQQESGFVNHHWIVSNRFCPTAF
jgi:hypothetical protein